MSGLLEAAAKDGIFKGTVPDAPEQASPPQQVEQQAETVESSKGIEKTEEQTPKKQDAKPESGGKPWENLDAPVQKEEAKVEEIKEDDIPPPPEGTNEKGKVTWKELHQAKRERDKLSAEMAELKKQLETASPKQAEEIRGELESVKKEREELAQLVAIKKMERSQEYQDAVAKPISKAGADIQSICKIGGIDTKELDAAIVIENDIERVAAIAAVLEKGETPLRSMHETALYDAVNKLHAAWQKDAEMRSKAAEIETAFEARQQAEMTMRQKKEQDEWNQARESMKQTLAKSLTDVFGNPETAREIEEQAVVPDNPTDRAYQAYAGALLPRYVRKTNELQARINELEGVIRDRNGAKPSMNSKQEAKQERIGPETTLLEAARQAGYYNG